MSDLSVAVLGVGGVGGYIAAALAARGVPVTCVAREATVAVIRDRGLRLESAVLGNLTTHPRPVLRLDEEPDLLFVTTKATQLAGALERLPPGPLARTIVIPLLNGLEHMAVLRQRLGVRVVAGSIRIESRLEGSAHVVQTSPFALIRLASDGGVPPAELAAAAAAISGAGLAVEVAASEGIVLWEKLARLAALACTTTLSRKSVGFVRTDPGWRALLTGAVREGVAVAAACGVPLDAAAQMKTIDAMPEQLTTSMYRDVAAGRRSELDAIAGAVVRAGQQHRIQSPILADLIGRIAASEESRCPQP